MKTQSVILALVLVVGVLVVFAEADKPEDTVNLVNKAVAAFKEQGPDAALKAINDEKGPFIKGEIYVFAVTMDNVLVGHPYDPSSRRINMSNMKDNSGFPVFQKFKEVVEKDGEGWVEYMWGKPGSDKPSRKRSFVKKVPDENIYLGAGYYVD
ncbi:MAG: cache domain-containing protein [Desulfomonilaceae bacterium]